MAFLISRVAEKTTQDARCKSTSKLKRTDAAMMENSVGVLQKIKTTTATRSSNSTSGY